MGLKINSCEVQNPNCDNFFFFLKNKNVATKCIKSYKKKILCLALTLATTFYPIFSLKIIFLMIIILRYQLKF